MQLMARGWGAIPQVAVACGVLVLATVASHAVQPATSPDDGYLDGLTGAWTMDGTLGGKPVHYLADGQRVLHGGFLRLHMIDAGSLPQQQYEADVFIGFDAKANDYIAHW